MGRGHMWIHVGEDICSVAGGMVHATDWITTLGGKRGERVTRKTFPTRCGRQRAKLLGVNASNAQGEVNGAMTVKWPPYVEEVREEGLERCPECFRVKPGKPNRMVPNPYDPAKARAT